MTRFRVAVPSSILLLTLSIPAAGQVDEGTMVPVAPHLGQQPTPAQDSSVITVRPELTDEQMGDLYMARKDYRGAAGVYKKLADRNPQNPVYLNKLGIALHQQTALSLALKYYERASKVDPLYADAQNNIGTIWYQRKKYGKAIKAYQKALAINNEGIMPVLYSNMGYAYFGDKKYEQAIGAFRQALAMDPQLFEHNSSRTGSLLQDRSVGDRGRFYYLLAKSFAEAGNVERCLIYLRKAKDEGYAQLNAAKTDPSFAAVLKDPAIQEVFAPKTQEATQP